MMMIKLYLEVEIARIDRDLRFVTSPLLRKQAYHAVQKPQ